MQTAFVTSSTGLLGNDLVCLLAGRGVQVKALARSCEKTVAGYRANGTLPVRSVAPGRSARHKRHGVLCPADRHHGLVAGHSYAHQH